MADPTQGYASYKDVLNYLMRDGRLREQVMSTDWSQERRAPPSISGLNESAAVADPFGATAIRRLMGYDINPMIQLNEAHGLVNDQNFRNGFRERR